MSITAVKTLLTSFIVFFSIVCIGQVDSAWIAQYMQKFTTDTGSYLPPINLVDESGNRKTLSDFKGKVLYIDIWTTWCGNCIGDYYLIIGIT